MSGPARRRFDGLIGLAAHSSTPPEEAHTAIVGARRVLATHPDIPRGERRIEAAESILERRGEHGDARPATGEIDRFARIARDVWQVKRNRDGTYSRVYS